MALCSYDNEVNQKYNIHKEKKMEDTETKEKTNSTMTIVEALKHASSLKKMARKGWHESLKKHFVTIKRGETKPSLSDGKHFSAFNPSIEDVMCEDWYIKEEGK